MSQDHKAALNSSYASKFSTSQINFNLNNAHQLIPREQTFVLDRKLITVHSEDRDIKQWPNANQFEVNLPTMYTNVSTLQLVECNITTTNYTFSREYQNIKFSFKVFPNEYSSAQRSVFIALNNGLPSNEGAPPSDLGDGGLANIFYAEISEGYYTQSQLARELEYKMNKAVFDFILTSVVSPADISAVNSYKYPHFKVHYDGVTQRLWIANTHDNFTMLFSKAQDYTGYVKKCDQPVVWNQGSHWGLPFFLGFDRKDYAAVREVSNEIHFGHKEPSTLWVSASSIDAPVPALYYVQAPFILDIYGDTAIYMEIEKMNSSDEIAPYRSSTNSGRGNDFNGTVNSYFAKIPLNSNSTGTGFAASNSYMYLYNIAQFNPVIDKLRRLKFTMRYHDGRLVDFRDTNFNFTICMGQIHDEIARNYILRVPSKY
jgi:hypothetical protein